MKSWDSTLGLSLLLAAVLFCLSAASAKETISVSFASFDYPGSTNTQATAISPSGEIVGRYFNADGRQHGFVLRDGLFSAVDVPGADSTDLAWINSRGEIVGTFDVGGKGHGYVLNEGAFTTFDFPSSNPVNTAAFGINDAGDIVGVEFVGNDFIHGHGYLFSHGKFTSIDVPGALGTFPTMVVDPTRIVGAYLGGNGLIHGFAMSEGKFSSIDFPKSTFTWITGINPEGDIVGFYSSKDGKQHGFVLNGGEFFNRKGQQNSFVPPDEKFISIDIPGATSSEGNGIDPQGDVVGRYVTPDGTTHGYLLRCAACSRHDKSCVQE